MSSQTNTITLNGKVYDAITGHPVHHEKQGHHKSQHHVSEHAVASEAHSRKTHPRTSAQHLKHRRPQHSKTLMRHIVKRPEKFSDFHASATLDADSSRITVISSEPTLLSPKDRTTRAHHIGKSRLISKFGPVGSQPSFVMSVEPVPIKPHPEEHEYKSKTPRNAAKSQHVEKLFSAALENAHPHHKAHPKPQKHTSKRKRAVRAGLVSLALVGLAGFTIMRTGQAVEFKLASSRAGIMAKLPDYHPNGYALSGPVEYAPGEVTVKYRSNSDDRSYSVTQKASSWNSEALSTHVLGASTDYQTIESKGKTLFLYKDGRATWVDGGIWYEIDSNGNLSQAQLQQVADSL